jgi:hypothetical protein
MFLQEARFSEAGNGFVIESASARVAIVEEAGASLQFLNHCLNSRHSPGIIGGGEGEFVHPRRFGA